MCIDRLKTKYKQILESSRAQTDQEDEPKTLKNTRTKNLSNMRVLTQYNQNVSYNNNIHHSSTYVLALKERIAQATHNLNRKDDEMMMLKEEIIRKDEKILILEQQISSCQMNAEQSQKRILEAKVYSASLQKEIENMKRHMESITMDKQLLQKQSEFYKGESVKISKQKSIQHKQIEVLQKSLKEITSLKAENKHLREDVKRMQEIVNQMCQNKLTTDFSDKHYLGMPMKEMSMWFSQNLVGEVEHFLKKEQVAQGNKKFISNLVKFIDKYTSTSSKRKISSSTNTRVKSNKTSHVRSASMCDPGFSTTLEEFGTPVIKRTQNLGTSVLKKSLLINKYKKMDARKFTSESIQLPQSCELSVFQEVMKEFRKALVEALGEKTVKPKTILGLADEMKGTLMELLEYNGY